MKIIFITKMKMNNMRYNEIIVSLINGELKEGDVFEYIADNYSWHLDGCYYRYTLSVKKVQGSVLGLWKEIFDKEGKKVNCEWSFINQKTVDYKKIK